MMELDKKWLVLGDCAIGRRRILSFTFYPPMGGRVSSNPTVFLHTAVLPCHAFVVRAKIKSRRDRNENGVEFEFKNEVELC